jgi:NitT/TauT family transport system substrate-binding protein
MSLHDLRGPSATVRILGIAILWLGLISYLHLHFNAESKSNNRVKMGYMPVVTNLAAPLVDFVSKGKDVYFEAIKFASFADMAEAFRTGHIQVAFIIAPLAIALYQQGVPLKVVYIGNRHESTLVVKSDCPCKTIADLAGKTIAVPIRYSGHLLALRKYLREHGMDQNAIRTVEVQPPDMPAALASGGIDGYFVGEPFASKGIQSGIGKRLADAESIWPEFICNVMIVPDKLIRSHPQWVQALVTGAVRSGFWARDHVDDAVKLAAEYWGQDRSLIAYTFSHPAGRFRFDLYTPVLGELEEIRQEMETAGQIKGKVDLHGMVDDSFTRRVEIRPGSSLQDLMSE